MEASLLDTSGFISQDSAQIKNAITRIQKLLAYTVPHGKLIRGNAVVSTFESVKLSQGWQTLDYDLLLAAHATGWCVQLAMAAFLVSDDIMDASTSRRGQACWHRLPEIGMTAVNDIMILQNYVYNLLDRFVQDHKQYDRINSLVLDMMNKTCIGQIIDTNATSMEEFNIDHYNNIVDYKTGYSISHPVRLGLLLAGVQDEELHAEVEDIFLRIGRLFQIQDDYLDLYGDQKTIGKNGTDIANNKCSWLIVKALEKANSQQRALLSYNYGVHREECVAVVKQLFNDLNIVGEFKSLEATQAKILLQKRKEFCQKRKNTSGFGIKGFPHHVFDFWINRLTGRNG